MSAHLAEERVQVAQSIDPNLQKQGIVANHCLPSNGPGLGKISKSGFLNYQCRLIGALEHIADGRHVILRRE